MTVEQLRAATGATLALAAKWLPYVEAACAAYGIDSRLRLAAFLANVGHESGGLRYTAELWGPTPAQKRYEGRLDLGNTEPGDGLRFRGHGLIQTTGRYNHAKTRDRMRAKFPDMGVPDFEADPGALTLPQWAALSAADFWHANGINRYADMPDFDGVCDVINRGRKTSRAGDTNGYADRLALYQAAQRVL